MSLKKNHTHPGIRYLKILDAVAHLSGNLHVEDNDYDDYDDDDANDNDDD